MLVLRGWAAGGMRMGPIAALIALVASLLPMGCAIQLVSNYDEVTDKGVTALHRDVEAFFLTLKEELAERPADALHAKHKGFYSKARLDLGTLRLRADSIPKNTQTVEQLKLLDASLADLERLHLLHDQAVRDNTTTNRLSPAIVDITRQLFHTHLSSILALEMAKKRGG
ncbi:MAG: hypothetical protein ACKVW3_08610 [Phycisphaerales bacterium]